MGAINYDQYTTFKVYDEISGNIVLDDQPIVLKRYDDVNSGEHIYEMDISTLGSGTYHIRIPGLGRSDTFYVGGQAVQNLYYKTMRGFYHQRCGTVHEEPYTWVTKPDYFRQVYESGNPVLGKPNCWVNPPDEYIPYPGEEIRTFSGGYHDAADFDSFTYHLWATLDILLAYEMFSTAFEDGDLNIPESGNGIPDILDEAEWGLKTFLELQNPDGSVPLGRGNESDGFRQNLLWMLNLNFQDDSYDTRWDYTGTKEIPLETATASSMDGMSVTLIGSCTAPT